MKKICIKTAVWIVTFFLSILILSSFMNQGNTDMTVEMGKATLPLVYMSQGGERINCLHGYVKEMRGSTMRDTITPLGTGRNLSITVEKLGRHIKNMSFEVRSVDGERLVEATDITQYTDEKEYIYASFTVKDLIEDTYKYS